MKAILKIFAWIGLILSIPGLATFVICFYIIDTPKKKEADKKEPSIFKVFQN